MRKSAAIASAASMTGLHGANANADLLRITNAV
jgi:hypothetical protein